MIRRWLLTGLWLGLVGYALWGAPPNQPTTFDMITDLSLGQIEGFNPLVVALFYLMGVWPLIYASVLLFDGQNQRLPAWPFVLASFGVGAFAVLPYLALRQPHAVQPGSNGSGILRWLNSRWNAGAIALLTLGLLAYGMGWGHWSDFVQQWQTSRFIHVMSLDFSLLCLLFPTLLQEDMAGRGWSRPRLFWLFSLLPLLGPVLYLMVRPTPPSSDRSELSSSPHPDAQSVP